MNGLRVFILDHPVPVAAAAQVFYSRRADGPYYRWWYEQTVEQWRSARVQQHEFPAAPLCASSWKSLPDSLQRRLVEHYQE